MMLVTKTSNNHQTHARVCTCMLYITGVYSMLSGVSGGRNHGQRGKRQDPRLCFEVERKAAKGSISNTRVSRYCSFDRYLRLKCLLRTARVDPNAHFGGNGQKWCSPAIASSSSRSNMAATFKKPRGPVCAKIPAAYCTAEMVSNGRGGERC